MKAVFAGGLIVLAIMGILRVAAADARGNEKSIVVSELEALTVSISMDVSPFTTSHSLPSPLLGSLLGRSDEGPASSALRSLAEDEEGGSVTNPQDPLFFPSDVSRADLGPMERLFQGVDRRVMYAVRWCESSDNPSAKNKTSSASGWFQVIRSTWEWAREGLASMGIEVDSFDEGRFEPEQNTRIAWWLRYFGGGLKHWDESAFCWQS